MTTRDDPPAPAAGGDAEADASPGARGTQDSQDAPDAHEAHEAVSFVPTEIPDDGPAFVPAEHGPTQTVRIIGAVLSGLGALPALWELMRLLTAAPTRGGVHDLSGLFAWSALALCGYSLVITLAQWRRAMRWPRDRDPRERPAHLLRDAHTLHAFWAAGVGGSLALVGLLGMWSAYDGNLSGLEPGWQLLLPGIAVIGVALGAKHRTDQRWEEIEVGALRARSQDAPPGPDLP